MGRTHEVPGPSREVSSRLLGPLLDDFIIGDGDTLLFFVFDLGFRAIGLAKPLGRILFRVQARAATTIGLVGFISGLHAAHDLVHFTCKTVHGLLRGKSAGVHVTDLLPPELCQLWIVRHVDARWRPAYAVLRAVELDE